MPPEPSHPPPVRVHWNDDALLDAAGGTPETIQALLARNGQPTPSRDTIYQWTSKRLVGDVWRAPLLFALFREARIEPRHLFRRSDGRRRA